MEKDLEKLYQLTRIEQSRELTEYERIEYVELVEKLNENDIEIQFGIEI